MRQNTAYYFLLLYLTVIARPLLPVVSDVASHFFAEAYHQVTVHARYGQNHLDKELAAAGADTKSQPGAVKSAETVPYHLAVPEVILQTIVHKGVHPYPPHNAYPLPRLAHLPEAPPPKNR